MRSISQRPTACIGLPERVVLPPLRLFFKLVDRRKRQKLASLPGAAKLYGYLAARLLPRKQDNELIPVNLHGFRMYLDPEELPGRLGAFCWGEYEPTTTWVFRELLSEGDVVVDAGAHWGYFTLLASRLSGARGHVFAFEPHPRNYTILTKNILANGLDNITAIQKAVSDQTGTVSLNTSRTTVGHSIFAVPPQPRMDGEAEMKIAVEAISLDAFFSGTAIQPKLVKIDIEGAESLALAGMHNLISRNPGLMIILELNPTLLSEHSSAHHLDDLAKFGFQFILIDDESRRLQQATKQDMVAKISQKVLCNLLCARENGIIRKLAR